MPTVKFRFPGGRYHATPWGHHVNEGLIEWPPCPWRVLRALLACGFSSQQWMEIPPTARRLIDKLAAVLPSYRLPPAAAAHSRHFMPVGTVAKGREQTTLVFDTWADIGNGEMLIHWPCELDGDETALMRQLAASLGYLGRSESWVEAELLTDDTVGEATFNAFPHREGIHPGREYEQVALVAAVPPDDYRAWREGQADAALAPFPLPTGKKGPSSKLLQARVQAVAAYPPDLPACLTKDTTWWKGHGWSHPPGSQRVLYWRRGDALQVGVPARPSSSPARSVTTMLLSLTTASGNRSALPPITRVLPQAELFHRAIVGRLANGQKVNCPALTGKNEHGMPLHDHHDHAHTLPVDLDGDGRIDHVIVYAKMGLGNDAQRAIRTLRRTWAKSSDDIQVALVGSGGLEMLRQLPRPLDRRVQELLGPPAGCRVWESATPFVFPRFLKRSGKNAILGQINAELVARRMPEVTDVRVDPLLTRELRHFVRRRNHGGVPAPVDAGYGLRLTFSEPVRGPFLLGYASHYGLGLFHACLVGE